ncbi:MAG TPA: hypothetical protein VGK04_01370, partial [Thermoanaerobaculia bacterium]
MKPRHALGLLTLILSAASVAAQPCRTSATTGASSSVTFAAGLPVAGTPANTASLDGSYLEISNLFGITTPSVRTMFST